MIEKEPESRLPERGGLSVRCLDRGLTFPRIFANGASCVEMYCAMTMTITVFTLFHTLHPASRVARRQNE